MRALGLDIGTKSLGVAITDENKSIVSPIANLKFSAFVTNQYLEAIKNIILKYGKFDTIVVGYPLKLNSLHSQWTDQVCFFVKQVQDAFPHQNVLLWDERNSTKKATEHLKFNLGLKSSQIKKHKDKFSAVVILQDYLDSL